MDDLRHEIVIAKDTANAIKGLVADRDRYREAYTKLDAEVALFVERISKGKHTPPVEVLKAVIALEEARLRLAPPTEEG